MELVVLDENYQAIEIIDNYGSLIWTDRYCDVGDFEIFGPLDTGLFQLLQNGKYLLYPKESNHGMIVERVQTRMSYDEGIMLIVSGRSFESILDRRIVWKQTVMDGSLQDELERLFNENLINPEKSERKIDNFIFRKSVDPTITSETITVQLLGDTLLSVVKSICEVYSLGFRVTMEGENLVFELYSGVDRSYEQVNNPYITFAPRFDNLISSEYSNSTTNYKNVTLVAGKGEGVDRTVLEVGGTTISGIDRREIFTDANDLGMSYYDEYGEPQTLTEPEYEETLNARGMERLNELSKETNFESQIDDLQTYQYGVDYMMGDILQIETEYGMSSRVRVVELIHSINVDGYNVYPTYEEIE